MLEAQQIKADLDQGKIPFYEYQYATGHITHNGQVIWHGQSLADAMLILQAKFPTARSCVRGIVCGFMIGPSLCTPSLGCFVSSAGKQAKTPAPSLAELVAELKG